jgi:peptidyl-prolyl cis-trans isomerase D
MLQSFNDRLKGPFTWIVVISISFIFVISGMSFFFTNFGRSSSYIAKVGDNEISIQQFQQYAQQATTEAQKRQVLDQMINQYLLLADSQRHDIVVSKLALQSAIFTNPMFFNEKGEFSSDKLQQVAGYLGGMSRLEQIVSQNIQASLISKTITETSFISEYENKILANIYSVIKNIEYIKISPKDLEKGISVNKNELKSYYESHKSQYMAPAKLEISYLVVSKDDFKTSANVSEQQIRAYYNDNRDLFNKFDNKAKDSIKKIIQNRQALEKFNTLTQNIDAEKFLQLEKLKKSTKANITDNSNKDIQGLTNSMFFETNAKYKSIAISDTKVLVYHADKLIPKAQQSFDQVKDKVTKAYLEQFSEELANKKAMQIQDDLNKSVKIKQSFTKASIEANTDKFPKDLTDFILANDNTNYHSYRTKNNDIYIYKVTSIKPKNTKDNQIPAQVLNAYKQEELSFYLQTIKQDIPVKVDYKNI